MAVLISKQLGAFAQVNHNKYLAKNPMSQKWLPQQKRGMTV
jgi:hypothetical protein